MNSLLESIFSRPNVVSVVVLWMRLNYFVARTMWRVECGKCSLLSLDESNQIFGFVAAVCCVALAVYGARFTEFHYTRRWRRMFSCNSRECFWWIIIFSFSLHLPFGFAGSLCVFVIFLNYFFLFFNFLVKAAIVSAHTPFVYLTFDLYVFSHRNNIM